MIDAQRFSYKIIDSSLGMVDRMPYLPLKLSLNDRSLNAEGLLDTGASVNVLPYELGLQLGLVWENETDTPTIPLSRKRSLTLEMIRKLDRELRIPSAILIDL